MDMSPTVTRKLSGILSVCVFGTPTDRSNVKFGMVIDFTDLKKIVKEEIVDQFDRPFF
jgi:6-pyruvoyl-tetrahydropterin synthase